MVLDRQAFRIVVLAAGIVFLLVGWLAMPVRAQDSEAGGDQYSNEPKMACTEENEEFVTSFNGGRDQTTDEFEITGPEWRFISEARPTNETASGTLDVIALPLLRAGESTFQTVFPDQEFDRQSSGVIDGPGTFRLDIDANGVEYTVVVCQISGGGQPPENGDEDNDSVIDDSIPDKDLPETGGISLIGIALSMFACAGLSFSVLWRRF